MQVALDGGSPLELRDVAGEATEHRARGWQRDLLPDHRAQQGLAGVEPSGNPDARGRGHERREQGIPREGLIDRGRVGVQIEPAPQARRQRRDIAESGQGGGAVHPRAFDFEAQAHAGRATGQADRALDAVIIDPLDTPRSACAARYCSTPGPSKGARAARRRLTVGAGVGSCRGSHARFASRERAQGARRQVVHLAHGVVELFECC